MADYLFRRGARYSFRRRYPNDVAAVLGKVEFVKALGTADRREAEKLARQVNVHFDNICEEALLTLAKSTAQPSAPKTEGNVSPTDENLAKSVLDRLPGIIRTVTESVIAEQTRNRAGWADVISWQKKALKAHIAGQMPAGIAMLPVEARTALKAINAAARGEPLELAPSDTSTPPAPRSAIPPVVEARPFTVDRLQLDKAFEEYAIGKSHGRKAMARRHALRVLPLPCTQDEAIAAITSWCTIRLDSGKKESTVWTEASAVISLLKSVPDWHTFTVPKIGTLRRLKGAGAARKDARDSIPVPALHNALRNLPTHLPRDGAYWHAVLLLCALYGMRPSEILRAGTESLQEQDTVWGTKQLIFKVGLSGAKNSASQRNLPVSEELRPLFRLALSRGECNSETGKSRGDKLNVLLRKAQGETKASHTLYSIRHLFADVARSCGYSDAAFGPIMGHKSTSGITAVYGGAGTLDNERAILGAVQCKLFPNGLAEFWPKGLVSSNAAV